MSQHLDNQAWNNFVLKSDPMVSGGDRAKRAAAIANVFMGGVNNGGFNSFLTATPELGSQEVLDALEEIGATEAAKQLGAVLTGLGQPLIRSSQEVRWHLLDRLWRDELDQFDVLSYGADAELMRVLEQHVRENRAYYLALNDEPS